MRRPCGAALWLLLSWGWLGAEPVSKEVCFNVVPSSAEVLILNDRGGQDRYPVGQPRLVTFYSSHFDLQIVANGWEMLEVPINTNLIVNRWPPDGSTLYLKPASWHAYLWVLPRWPLLGLLLLPWLWRRRQRPQAPPLLPPPAQEARQEARLPWELERDSRVDRYCIQEKLGEGASGVVYRVRDGDTELALKLIKPQPSQNQDLLPRFRREMKMMCRLKHPNIPYLADVGEFRGMSYLVMELLGTLTLQDKLRPGPLPPAQAWNVLCQLARALAFCHRQGILHRDIKPENVIWGDGQRVRLTDFGLARHSNSSTLTQEGTIMGTPAYMAPEIVLGEGASAASDQYSLGCLAYHLLSGSPPFEAENPMAVLMQHIDKEPAPLRQASAPFAEIVLRMLRKRPEQRFADVDELLTRLEKLGA